MIIIQWSPEGRSYQRERGNDKGSLASAGEWKSPFLWLKHTRTSDEGTSEINKDIVGELGGEKEEVRSWYLFEKFYTFNSKSWTTGFNSM